MISAIRFPVALCKRETEDETESAWRGCVCEREREYVWVGILLVKWSWIKKFK